MVLAKFGYFPKNFITQKAFKKTSGKKKIARKFLTIFVVPLAGLEPARMLLRGILSPLRLPIPPQRRIEFYGGATQI